MAGPAGQSPASFATVLRAALVPAAVTALVFLPELFRDPQDVGETPSFTLLWVGALLLAAPVAAYLMNRRVPVATDAFQCLRVASLQLPVLVLLMALDVWLDVRSGYLLAGSGEEAMSYGLGTFLAVVLGLVLTTLVGLAARLGARRRQRRASAPDAPDAPGAE